MAHIGVTGYGKQYIFEIVDVDLIKNPVEIIRDQEGVPSFKWSLEFAKEPIAKTAFPFTFMYQASEEIKNEYEKYIKKLFERAKGEEK